MSKYYVLLTGSKNNAGDYLIKHRAKNLLRQWRPDREFVDMNGWEPITDEALEVINGSEALVLTGGPAVNVRMRPVVYALRENLNDIKVPITTYGVGWRAVDGRWSRTKGFGFNGESVELLQRVQASGLMASVRDFHTQNVLNDVGIERAVMTGCPALYSPEHLGAPLDPAEPIRGVTISLGVHFARSQTLEAQSKELVTATRELFPQAEVTVAFHHSTTQDFAAAYGKNTPLYAAQLQFMAWLDARGVAHVDLSGSADNLLQHYGAADLHLGYRVHAHILMTGIRKPSLLLAEDGRGFALKDVLGGHILDAFEAYDESKLLKAARKLGLNPDPYTAAPGLAHDAVRRVKNDEQAGWPQAKSAVNAIENHLPTMKRFVESLP